MISRTKLRLGFRWLLGIAFVLQGINHFMTTDVMVRMMPEVLPAPRLLVWLSGVAEIVLGLLVFPAQTRRLAGWGLVLLLLAVFPANVHMALHPEDWPLPPAALWARLPLQLVLLYWVWATCIAVRHGLRPSESSEEPTKIARP